MISPDEVHAFGVLNLQSQEQAYCFKGVCPSIHIVPKEEVVYVGDVTSSAGSAIFLKQAHEI